MLPAPENKINGMGGRGEEGAVHPLIQTFDSIKNLTRAQPNYAEQI